MLRKIGFGMAGAVALVGGVAFGSAFASSLKKAEVKPERFSVLAPKYDHEVGSTEVSVGIDKLRKGLTEKAYGKVLETCAGTGRNNAYYDPSKVSEITLMDYSQEMLDEALKKPFQEGINAVKAIQATNLESFPDEYFDTVLDTFGICSVDHPEQFLKQVERILKPGGSALFLEHGRAESKGIVSKLVNTWLDFRAHSHASYFGCLWNRRIGDLIEKSGLEIKRKEVHHYGTSTEVEAIKPRVEKVASTS